MQTTISESEVAPARPASPGVRWDIIGYSRFWFAVSLAIAIVALGAILMGGLKLGIDFTGGTLIQAKFDRSVSVASVREIVEERKLGPAVVQTSEGNVAFIRTKGLTADQEQNLRKGLEEKVGKFTIQRKEFVGPTIGQELLTNGLIALSLVLGGIVAYLTFRFKLDYAVVAIVALAHDLLVTIGVFAILGMTVGTEVDSLFITAILTVAGFSVHDTIVIFDRIRENLYKAETRTDLATITNFSLNQTMARSINTSLTVVITLTALFLFGGETIRDFTLALLVGIISGTYSSIFMAGPLLVWWRQRGAARPAEAQA